MNQGPLESNIQAWSATGSDAAKNPPPAGPRVGDPILTDLSTVTPRNVEWLWPQHLPRGKVVVFGGEPGQGKSICTLDLAARVSTGAAFPDGSANNHGPGGVVLFSFEDALDDTVVPRLIAAGANLTRFHHCDSVVQAKGGRKHFTLADLPTIERAIEQTPGCQFVVIDPIAAFMGEKNMNRSEDVRGLLDPLSRLADRTGVCIIIVAHLNKGDSQSALNRISGSTGLVAVSRLVWIVAKDEADKDRRLFAPAKSNIGRKPETLAFTIVGEPGEAARIVWSDQPVNITADDALSPERGGREAPQRERAEAFIAAELKGGRLPATEMYLRAGKVDISPTTLDRAKRDMRVVSKPDGFGGPHYWYLPEHLDPFPLPP